MPVASTPIPPRFAPDGWPDNRPAWESLDDAALLDATRVLMAPGAAAIEAGRRRWLKWAALWQVRERLARQGAALALLAVLSACGPVLDDVAVPTRRCHALMSWARTYADSVAVAGRKPAGWLLTCGELIAAPGKRAP